jgi:hypothetical protein
VLNFLFGPDLILGLYKECGTEAIGNNCVLCLSCVEEEDTVFTNERDFD